MKQLKLGSLFDGSGGFPLAGVINGIEPIWSSEIEPYPLKVTALRFPTVKQLGDATKINGAVVEPVDIITFGSPCQDLSVAGKQAGIHNGERSNLFFEAIRIIKEMRNGTANEFPRWAVWENVPGAFSSNRGEDFRAVIEAFAGVVQDGLDIPRPEKWPHAGGVAGNGWSLAWRVYDAQYWGVPQRRKRIYLIADFRGERAGEILFERESVSGDFEARGTSREGTATDAERGAGGSGCIGIDQQGGKGTAAYGLDVSPTLCSDSHGTPHGVCYPVTARSLCARADSSPCIDRGQNVIAYSTTGTNCGGYKLADTSATLLTKYHYGSGGDAALCVYDARGNGDGKTVPNLTGDHENRVTDYTAICIGNSQTNNISMKHVANTLATLDDAQKVLIQNSSGGGVAGTLMASYYKGAGLRNGAEREYIVERAMPPRKYIVRRLTPLECCRLQGFPDWWEDGADGSDSARYKMWGNGIALPCAVDVLRRIAKAEEDEDHE